MDKKQILWNSIQGEIDNILMDEMFYCDQYRDHFISDFVNNEKYEFNGDIRNTIEDYLFHRMKATAVRLSLVSENAQNVDIVNANPFTSHFLSIVPFAEKEMIALVDIETGKTIVEQAYYEPSNNNDPIANVTDVAQWLYEEQIIDDSTHLRLSFSDKLELNPHESRRLFLWAKSNVSINTKALKKEIQRVVDETNHYVSENLEYLIVS